MSRLKGFDEYMQEHAGRCVFEELGAGGMAVWHLHGRRVVQASLVEHSLYEATLQPEDGQQLVLHKTQIKFFCAVEYGEEVEARAKSDAEVVARELEPIMKAGARYIVKNKTLYVLMHERTVVTCTLLEGDVLRGLVAEFSRYTVTLHLKGGIPVTVMRHAILDLRDKAGQSQLKVAQDRCRDWKKSELYIAQA
jgi:sRNA-binding regulator protein Hfq